MFSPTLALPAASRRPGRMSPRAGVCVMMTASALAIGLAAPVNAGIGNPPATLDFGLGFGDWGVAVDSNGDGGTIDQGFEIYDLLGPFGGAWSLEDEYGSASSHVNGAVSQVSDAGTLVLEIAVSLSLAVAMSADAPSDLARSTASASISSLDLYMFVEDDAFLTIESMMGDGGWITESEYDVSAGSMDLSLSGFGLFLEAGRGESLTQTVAGAWRITVSSVPAPGGLAVLGLAAAAGSRRRRRV